MADVVWPVGLPQSPRVGEFSQSEPDLTVRTSMSVGPAKVRRRVTTNVIPVQIALVLTRAQVALFQTFYRDSIQGGALAFEWINHQTGNPIDWRITSRPELKPRAPRQDAAAEIWILSFAAEMLPWTEVTSEPPPPPPPPPPPVGGAILMGPALPRLEESEPDDGNAIWPLPPRAAPTPPPSIVVTVLQGIGLGATGTEEMDPERDTTFAPVPTTGGSSTTPPPNVSVIGGGIAGN